MFLVVGSLVALLGCSVPSVLSTYAPTWDSLDSRPLPGWYDESKVGIFLHWGVFSVPSFGAQSSATAGEWFWWYWRGQQQKEFVQFMNSSYPPDFKYSDFAPMWKAELWDPDAWAQLFADSGARYVVLTSKHHEGFTLWPSKGSWNWNAMDTGPHRDLVGELATAVRKQPSLHFGLYHSLFEWFNPIYLNDKKNGFSTNQFVADKTGPELHEIINQYEPELIWSDGDWEASDTYWNSTNFLAWLYNDSPVKDTVVVNDRWGKGVSCKHGGYYTCQDRYNPGHLIDHKWENAMTLDKGSWGFCRTSPLSNYLSIEQLINEIVVTVSCGGNILINVGPTADGRIEPIFQERLLQMGAWLKTNGAAIYGSHPWTAQNDSVSGDVWYTLSSDKTTVYAISLSWPASHQLLLGSVTTMPKTVTLVGYEGALQFAKGPSAGIAITLPHLDTNDLQWAWVFALSS
ncbi:alpha-L-fucosidase-like [Sycon ciliatum]|uniref:alpha-L-fucosidase-like n=1 Tax=Sycon ciliatum TaxID=27933 RepID=UPI0031F6D6EF